MRKTRRSKRFLFFFVAITLLLLNGCGYYNNTEDPSGQPETSGTATPLVTEELSPTKIEATEDDNEDVASFFINNSIAASEDTYYFVNGESGTSYFLWKYDLLSGQAMPFCGQADCDHSTKNCQAYLDETLYYVDEVFYEQHRIYMIKCADDGAYLVSWAEDTSDYRTHGKLWEKNAILQYKQPYYQIPMIINSGCIYYLQSEDFENYRIYRYSVTDKEEPQLIADFEIVGNQFVLYHSGEALYLTVSQMEVGNYGVWVYRVETDGTLSEPLYESEGVRLCGIYVKDEILYCYEWNTGVVSCNLNTAEQKIIYPADDTGNRHLVGDGDYLYLNNAERIHGLRQKGAEAEEGNPLECDTITILTLDGEVVDQIVFSEQENVLPTWILFGDKRYLFSIREQGDDFYVPDHLANEQTSAYLAVYDKRLIGSGLSYWVAVAPWECKEVR